MAQLNLSRSVLANTLSIGTSQRLHHATLMWECESVCVWGRVFIGRRVCLCFSVSNYSGLTEE